MRLILIPPPPLQEGIYLLHRYLIPFRSMRDQPRCKEISDTQYEEILLSPTKRCRIGDSSKERIKLQGLENRFEQIYRDFERSTTMSRNLAVLSHLTDHNVLEESACDASINYGIIGTICLKVGFALEVNNNSLCERGGKNQHTGDEYLLFIKKAMEALLKLYIGCSVRVLESSLINIGDKLFWMLASVIELQMNAFLKLVWIPPESHQPSDMLIVSNGHVEDELRIKTLGLCLDLLLKISQQLQGFDAILQLRPQNKDFESALSAVIQVLIVLTIVSHDPIGKDLSSGQSIKDVCFCKAIEAICNLICRASTQEAVMQSLQNRIALEKGGFLLEILRQVSISFKYPQGLRECTTHAIEEIKKIQAKTGEGIVALYTKEETAEQVTEEARILQLVEALSPHAKNFSGYKEDLFLKVIHEDNSRIVRLIAASGLYLSIIQSFTTTMRNNPNLMRFIVKLLKQEPDRSVQVKLVEGASFIAAKITPDYGDAYDDNLQLLKDLMYSDDMKLAEYAIDAIYQQTLTSTDSIMQSIKRVRIANFPDMLNALASVSTFLRVSLFSQKHIAEIFLNISEEATNGEQMTSSMVLESLMDLSSLPVEGRTVREVQIVERIRMCALCTIVRLARGVPNRRKIAKQPGLMLTLIRFASSPTDRIAGSSEDLLLNQEVKETLIKLTQAL